MNSSGDITMWVPSRQAVLSLSTTCPAALHCSRSALRPFIDAAAILRPVQNIARIYFAARRAPERWQSGRMRQTRNLVYGSP